MYIYLFIILLFLLVVHYKNYFRSVYLALNLPGPSGWVPLIGHALLINEHKVLQDLSLKAYDTFGPLFKCWISVVPFFIVNEPEFLKILLGNTTKPPKKNVFYTLMHTFIGEGLITNNGIKWKGNRKLIQPYFRINVLKNFIGIFQENAEILVQNLKNKGEFNITKDVNRCVLKILHEAILGISEADLHKSPFGKMQVLIPYRVSRPWLIVNSFFKLTKHAQVEETQKNILQSYTRQILREKLKSNNKTNNGTLLEMLIEISETNSCFTEDDIVNETTTFMLAGQESVGAAIVFTLYFLAKHPEIQQKLIDELNQIFQFKGKGENITFDDLMEMKYLEQCIKESMRLCPPVPIVARELTEDVTLGKYVLPAGSNIFIAPFAIHRIKHLYPEPEKFDPERFSKDNLSKIHPFGYLPFLAGTRNCIGYKYAMLEIKVILSEILRNYHLELVPGHEELNLSYRITLRVSGGVWLRLKHRDTVI